MGSTKRPTSTHLVPLPCHEDGEAGAGVHQHGLERVQEVAEDQREGLPAQLLVGLDGDGGEDVEGVDGQVADQDLVEDAPQALGHAADGGRGHVARCAEQTDCQDAQPQSVTDPAEGTSQKLPTHGKGMPPILLLTLRRCSALPWWPPWCRDTADPSSSPRTRRPPPWSPPPPLPPPQPPSPR